MGGRGMLPYLAAIMADLQWGTHTGPPVIALANLSSADDISIYVADDIGILNI